MAVISRVERTLGPDHTALVLFDTLNGFVAPKDNPKRAAYLREHNIMPNLTRLLKGARDAGLTTFYPMGVHAPDGSDTVLRLTDTDINLNPLNGEIRQIGLHLKPDSKEAEFPKAIKPGKNDVVITKHRWSAFFDTDLHFHLRMRNIDTIVLAGGSTDVGLASTIFAARDLDLGIVIVRDACYSTRDPNQDFLMERMFPRMGRILSVDETIALMQEGAGKPAKGKAPAKKTKKTSR